MEDDLVDRVFFKYSSSGRYLKENEFIQLSRKLIGEHSRYPNLHKAFYTLFRENRRYVYLESFHTWWKTKEQYIKDDGLLLEKAYDLYKYYTTSGRMKKEDFEELLDDLQLPIPVSNFQYLDVDSNGVLTFSEFINWLKWFS